MGEHLQFIRELPLYRRSGDVIFVHAGIAAGDGETLRNERAMMWGDSASDPDWPVPGKLIVHGHYDCASPIDRPGRMCVDTGAYYSGQLTAAVLDEGHAFLSVRK
jgi:serine/threonine protein phosphatase 1